MADGNTEYGKIILAVRDERQPQQAQGIATMLRAPMGAVPPKIEVKQPTLPTPKPGNDIQPIIPTNILNALKVAVPGFGGILSKLGGIAGAFGGVAALAGPVGIAVAGVAALGAVSKNAAKGWETARRLMDAIHQSTMADIVKYRTMSGDLAAAVARAQAVGVLSDINAARERGPTLAMATRMDSFREVAVQRLGNQFSPIRNYVNAWESLVLGTGANILAEIVDGIVEITKVVRMGLDAITGVTNFLGQMWAEIVRAFPLLNAIKIALTAPSGPAGPNAWAMQDIRSMTNTPNWNWGRP